MTTGLTDVRTGTSGRVTRGTLLGRARMDDVVKGHPSNAE